MQIGKSYFYPRPPRGGRPRRSWPICSGCTYFYPRPPRGGRRHCTSSLNISTNHFYPRPPRGGRRILAARVDLDAFDFYPRPPRGGRLNARTASEMPAEFLSTPSARRATEARGLPFPTSRISIHALREEGDHLLLRTESKRKEFLSTPSARRATVNLYEAVAGLYISIHALREEGDQEVNRFRLPAFISIHALREEGDGQMLQHNSNERRFLSTPSARRATAARMGPLPYIQANFYPRPPRGGRRRFRW